MERPTERKKNEGKHGNWKKTKENGIKSKEGEWKRIKGKGKRTGGKVGGKD